MMVMRITVKTQSKPELAFQLGSVQRDGNCGHGESVQGACKAAKCESCTLDAIADCCPTIRSCTDIFAYFHDVVSYEKATANLVKSEQTYLLRGSAQCVAAFAILCCLVYSGCTRLSGYEFLLRQFCLIQGRSGEIADLDRIFPGMLREKAGIAPAPESGECYAQLIDLLDQKIQGVIAGYDKLSRHDTLRNAFQILYSVGSLAFRGADGNTCGQPW